MCEQLRGGIKSAIAARQVADMVTIRHAHAPHTKSPHASVEDHFGPDSVEDHFGPVVVKSRHEV